MNRSVQTIADQLLSGQDVSLVTGSCSAKEQLIREVFDKVLVGYTVQQVIIVPGRTDTGRCAPAAMVGSNPAGNG
ncbi:MAG: hypothetical protein LKE51_09315 [Selenomonas sp.]|jgi:hypothetical protein|nr:hypothetical protein [Selenomonas sp.]